MSRAGGIVSIFGVAAGLLFCGGTSLRGGGAGEAKSTGQGKRGSAHRRNSFG